MAIKTLKKTKLAVLCFALLIAADSAALTAKAKGSDQSEVRNAIQHVFDQLKAGQYGTLYDGLPSSSRARIQRERFVNGLQNTRSLYQLERIEIGPARVSGDLAVVDTVMYAHIPAPFDTDGKLVVQQYLVREDGHWKVATGDRQTIDRFLKNNPTFARKFPIKRPSAFIKKDGKWIEFKFPGRK